LCAFSICCIFLSQNDYNKAIESIRKAIELDRENPEYWLLLGEYLNRNGKINEAEEMFTFAADHFPNESDVWLFYSDFYVMNQQVEKAIEVLYKGIDIHPDNISYLYRMANYYYLKDDAIQGNSFLTLAYISSPELLDEFLEYDEKMYDIPDVVNFLTNINNINE
jgi:tetratricopeptide (TPR) repeat protein